MANTLYDNARKMWAEGNIAWGGDDQFNCCLVNANYTFGATHIYASEINPATGGPRDYGVTAGAGKPMAGLAVATNGAIYAENVRFETVAADRPPVTAIVIYRFGTEQTDSPLIYYANVATGLPITPNGGDIIVTWSLGTNRILRL